MYCTFRTCYFLSESTGFFFCTLSGAVYWVITFKSWFSYQRITNGLYLIVWQFLAAENILYNASLFVVTKKFNISVFNFLLFFFCSLNWWYTYFIQIFFNCLFSFFFSIVILMYKWKKELIIIFLLSYHLISCYHKIMLNVFLLLFFFLFFCFFR